MSDNTPIPGKPIWLSKTMWTNLIALLGILFQNQLGFDISADESAAILAVVNLIMRLLTKQPLQLMRILVK